VDYFDMHHDFVRADRPFLAARKIQETVQALRICDNVTVAG
jgi:hypothetical protein